jgi:hypothetical protein
MKPAVLRCIVRLEESRLIVFCTGLALASAGSTSCSSERPPTVHTIASSDRAPREAVVETPRVVEVASPYRTKLSRGAELYLPPWFSPHHGTYDLVVHFHGLGKLQEGNLERSQIDAAVVSVNLGAGTTPYSNAFRDPRAFQKLLDEAQEEVEKSGRAPGAKIGRIALSAWSAGFVSVARIMRDPANAERVDAVLLADGFFTSFTNPKKRVINTASLERFVTLADAASRNDKLFAITHSSIPTVDYPSVEETVGKLLEMTSVAKTSSTIVGPRDMHETYAVDHGNFHVRGYEGVTARDHIKQIHAMGETLYPYLKARWERPEPGSATARLAP